MSSALKEKVVLITGGGRGIGRATACRLAMEGATVMVCSRSEPELREAVSEIRKRGGQADYHVTDLGVPDQIHSMVSKIQGQYHRVDILINNASLLGPMVSLWEYPLDEWSEILQVNLTGLFLLTKEILGAMIHQRSGCIINLTSSVGRTGRAGWGGYAVSKFGVEGLTQVLANEVGQYNIRVIALNPGATRTLMRAHAYPQEDPATLKPPEDVAKAICFLVLNEDRALFGKSLDTQAVLERMKAT